MSAIGCTMSSAPGTFDVDGELDVGDGLEEGESTLQAGLAASRCAEAKSAQELQLELEAIRLRLLRRSQIIDALRSAYVRDVVVVKNELMRKAALSDEEYAAQGGPGTDITDAVPSLDMRPVLALFSPEDAFLRVESCTGCGGHLEIVTKETKRVAKLNKRISDMNEQMAETAKEAAHLRAELMLTRHRVHELEERNTVNRDTLVAKLEKTQKNCESDVQQLKEEARRSGRAWEAKLARKDEQLEVIPVLQAEMDILRQALADEQASREEDLHHKDGEIAALKAKVAHLELSAEADVKLLLEARTNTEDIKRRLKAEREKNTVTTGLLEEERVKYERCRARLETSQEHLADLNERFNELRAEVESSAEHAEEEADEANDALTAAKMEIKRLRGLLGTSDASAALDAATLKVSSISTELEEARSDALEANEALRECQKQLQMAQAQLEAIKGTPQSMASRFSDGDEGLSWAGSTSESLGEDGSEAERKIRMPSAMSPGSSTFEKGKRAVEKRVALVHFQKAMNAHPAEIALMHKLFMIAQGREVRSRLTPELKETSKMETLEGMDGAMHLEVAVLKQKAAGQSSGGDGGDSTSAGTLGEASSEIKIGRKTKAEREASGQDMEILKSRHEAALEELRLELSRQKEDNTKLESEAVEMKERLKKLDKLEKAEKGHNAMTEELKKMEKETGLSVGLESSMDFTTAEGDLSKEDEDRLIEELENAKDEIKNMKMRQAMVTHELLGTIKGANAEVEMLKAALADMTAQRDARVDVSTLAGMTMGMSGDEMEEFKALKEDAKSKKKKIAALQEELHEVSKAFEQLLGEMRKSCKETSRAKATVWNLRELERARSVPPEPKNSSAFGSARTRGRGGGSKMSAAVAGIAATKMIGGRGRSSAEGPPAGGVNDSVPPSFFEGGLRKPTGAPSTGEGESARPHEDAAACTGGPTTGDGGGDGGEGDDGEGGGTKTGTTGDDEKETVLEKRRRDRAAQALEKKRLAEIEQQEMEEFEEACLLPRSEGVAFAAEKLEAAREGVKEQFKEVFLDLRETLEMHKKFVMRSRLEAREFTGKITALQTELDRLRQLQVSTEEQLRGRSAVLAQTQKDLTEERNAGATTRRELVASQEEARDNFFFKEKNARLQKQMDMVDAATRRARQESEKAKRELKDQGEHLLELRKFAEEAERKEKAFMVKEETLEVKISQLEGLYKNERNKVEELEMTLKSGLAGGISAATQANGLSDPDLGLGAQGSTQTDFHCPGMTLRRSNNRGTFPSKALSAGSGGVDVSSQPFREDPSNRRGLGIVNYVGGAGGFVCPVVDGRAMAADRDLYSPGDGTAEFLEMQDSVAGHSLRGNALHPDAYSDSLQQLSYQSPTWLLGANDLSIDGNGGTTNERERGAASQDPESIMSLQKLRQRQQEQEQEQQVKAGDEQPTQWGLWHEADGVGGVEESSEEPKCPEVPAEVRGPAIAVSSTLAGGDSRRPETTSDCLLKADGHEGIHRCSYRPQTSPSAAFLAGSRGDGNDAQRIAWKSPPRLRSRLLVQSAMDLSLSSPGGGGQHHHSWRQGVSSTSETGRRTINLNGASLSSLPASATVAGGYLQGVVDEQPSTPSTALPDGKNGLGEDSAIGEGLTTSKGSPSRGRGGGGVGFEATNDKKYVPRRKNDQGWNQVIDLGVVSDSIPRPKMWGDQQLAAAAAAATGRSTSAGTGKVGEAGGGWTGVASGGVVLDARFAKLKKTLRRDLLDVAERARLPLLQ